MHEAVGENLAFEEWFQDRPQFRKDEFIAKHVSEDKTSQQKEGKAQTHRKHCDDHKRKRFSDARLVARTRRR